MWIRTSDGTLHNLDHLRTVMVMPIRDGIVEDGYWLYAGTDDDDDNGVWLERYPTQEQAEAALADLTAALGKLMPICWLRKAVQS